MIKLLTYFSYYILASKDNSSIRQSLLYYMLSNLISTIWINDYKLDLVGSSAPLSIKEIVKEEID